MPKFAQISTFEHVNNSAYKKPKILVVFVFFNTRKVPCVLKSLKNSLRNALLRNQLQTFNLKSNYFIM